MNKELLYLCLCLKFNALLQRCFPSQYLHGDVVGTPEVPFHLDDQIRVTVKGHMVIKAFLVVSVAAFHFPVMSGCAGAY